MKLQTCLLFIIALPVIVVLFVIIGIPVLVISFGALSSIIGASREMMLPLVCIFGAITIIGISNYVITSRKHKKMEKEREIAIEKDIARFEGLSTPEEYIAYYEEKLQEQKSDLQRAIANGMQVGRDPYIRYLYEKLTGTKRNIKMYKRIIDLPKSNEDENIEIRP